jgi:DNA-binding response OmpR family regulator
VYVRKNTEFIRILRAEMKILVIEDNHQLRETITEFLRTQRYVVEEAATYSAAQSKVLDYDYDCILLDVMLPDGNGLRLLDELRREGKQGNVIIISARDAIEDKIAGLEGGADDYLAKPFHLAELAARIRSVLRRKERGGERTISLGNVTVDPDTFSVTVAGQPLELSRKEYDILDYFAGRPGLLVEKTALAEAVWGDHIDGADNFDFIYTQIKNLRRKLHDAGATIELKAVYGFGYKLLVP